MSWPRFTLALLVAAAGCQDLPQGPLCGTIPGEGCPIDIGGTCADPTCSGVYECLDGQWALVQACPTHDGGTGGMQGTGGMPVQDAGPGDASDGDACTPVKIDLSGEAMSCTPDLENPPDCPAQAALGCAETACLTGCTDFWLCTTSGWVPVAYCTCEGQLVVTQK